MAMITAFSTVVSMIAFLAICWWAWSAGRQPANAESALLPFALPDEPLAASQERSPAGGANHTKQGH
ncbi:cbb3-type cytochrome oxidase subunit 3 [Cupriavidus sp. 2TAF22]|uniref:cbb3-type cytochrome oxidase subunit 3 n=1 Tax=unclassified Cupriavidus TaxID=2640874 RepID=UPI003F9248A1